jgi:Flp pilus assembly protein TadD
MMRGQACEQLGEMDAALEALATASRLSSGNSKPVATRAYVLARMGQDAGARDVATMLEEVARSRFVPPYAMALIHAGLGEHQTALEWLERAHSTRDVHLVFLPVDPKWDRFRADPRFAALLERCGFGR